MASIRDNKARYKQVDIVRYYEGLDQLRQDEVMVLLGFHGDYAGRHVLDIGCGAGRTTRFLAPFSRSYLGIDYSESMVEACKNRFSELEFKVMDVCEMRGLADGQFDFCLFSFNGLDSLSHENRLLALQEIRRVIRPGGVFAFSTHNRAWIRMGKATVKPMVQFSINPVRFAQNMWSFFRQVRNFRQTIGLLRNEKEYAIVNDGAHDFSIINYYIDVADQISQLTKFGFIVEKIFNKYGEVVDSSNLRDTDHTYSMTFVARKV